MCINIFEKLVRGTFWSTYFTKSYVVTLYVAIWLWLNHIFSISGGPRPGKRRPSWTPRQLHPAEGRRPKSYGSQVQVCNGNFVKWEFNYFCATSPRLANSFNMWNTCEAAVCIRVARWFDPNLGKFWRVVQWKMLYYIILFYGHLNYFMAIWYIMWYFGLFSAFWYVVPRKIW
jgi:hypothetical protein